MISLGTLDVISLDTRARLVQTSDQRDGSVQILMQVGPVHGYDARRGGKGPLQGIWACLQHMAAKEGWRVRQQLLSVVCII